MRVLSLEVYRWLVFHSSPYDFHREWKITALMSNSNQVLLFTKGTVWLTRFISSGNENRDFYLRKVKKNRTLIPCQNCSTMINSDKKYI